MSRKILLARRLLDESKRQQQIEQVGKKSSDEIATERKKIQQRLKTPWTSSLYEEWNWKSSTVALQRSIMTSSLHVTWCIADTKEKEWGCRFLRKEAQTRKRRGKRKKTQQIHPLTRGRKGREMWARSSSAPSLLRLMLAGTIDSFRICQVQQFLLFFRETDSDLLNCHVVDERRTASSARRVQRVHRSRSLFRSVGRSSFGRRIERPSTE